MNVFLSGSSGPVAFQRLAIRFLLPPYAFVYICLPFSLFAGIAEQQLPTHTSSVQ